MFEELEESDDRLIHNRVAEWEEHAVHKVLRTAYEKVHDVHGDRVIELLNGSRAQTRLYKVLLEQRGYEKMHECLWTRVKAKVDNPLPIEVRSDFLANVVKTMRVAHSMYSLSATSAFVRSLLNAWVTSGRFQAMAKWLLWPS